MCEIENGKLGMEWSLCVVCSECWMVRRKQTVGGSNRQWWLVV